ncbi:DUF2793 domain-containing protein [Pseudomonas sp.]|uniref:DUF2793 domain-containing protein n=1 Tax=Pseudomonas sp. TaxID=306 RepID=UPI00290F5D58|nr:DUF2793 domain-containing protein [Pseudomonas sp.]MDU4248996.1 DUF2793 domain-containing protein [Pseudomonas sp.]
MSNTPKTGIEELSPTAANQAIIVNTGGYAVIDQLLVPTVVDKDLTAAPGSPVDGAMYIMASAWSGITGAAAGRLVFWRSSSSSWTVITPKVGWRVAVLDELDANSVPKQYACVTSGATSTWSQPDVTGGAVTSVNGKSGAVTVLAPIIIACSDETTPLTTGTAKVTFRIPYAFTLTGVRASLTSAQTSGSILTVDINEGGTSILSTKLTIDNNEKTSTTAATPPVISDSSLADDAEITIDIDQIGNGTAAGLKVTLIGYQP